MGFKTSHSQNSSYLFCPKKWSLQYQDGWLPETEGASLPFGTAMDRAVSSMLEGNHQWLQKFYDNWETEFKNGQIRKILDDDKIVYSNKDFDGDILEQQDIPILEKWAKELSLLQPTATPSKQDLIDLFRQCSKAKSSPYITATQEQLKYFNKCSWLSLKRKGKLLLTAFEQQVKPKIKRIISLQKRGEIKDESTGDGIIGYIDMVLELEGYNKAIIFDLKTASMLYDQFQVDVSPQLTLYAAMEGKTYNTDLVGYLVLPKNIQKDSVFHCKTCGFKKATGHRTCNNILGTNSNARCGGIWEETKIPIPQVQIMVEKKTPEQINDLLVDIGNMILAMKNGIVYKNTNRCQDHFGSNCPFINLCHKGDSTGLIQKIKK